MDQQDKLCDETINVLLNLMKKEGIRCFETDNDIFIHIDKTSLNWQELEWAISDTL